MRRFTIALLIAAAAVAGCGGDDEESASTPTPTAEETQAPASGGESGGKAVAVSSPADGALKFDQADLTAPAGKVTFTYSNPSGVPHAFEIEGNGVEAKTETVTDGNASVSADLKAGKYEFYCPVDSHEQAGMKGTLTVN
jgi:plastocyanin